MHTHLTAALALAALSTQRLVTHLQKLFGPLLLQIVVIAAIIFLFIREITSVSVMHCAFRDYCGEFLRARYCTHPRRWYSERAWNPLILSSDEGERR
jgi:hypothetical protein